MWPRWYDAVLAGVDRFVEPVEVFRATRPEEFWTQPVAAINAAIKDEEARWASLEPRPAAHDFRVVDGRIDVMPEDARPIDAETAQDPVSYTHLDVYKRQSIDSSPSPS